MKKSVISVLLITFVTLIACSLTACFFEKTDDKDDEIYVTYHLNGGYRNGDPTYTEDYDSFVRPLDLYEYKPITAEKDTWYLQGWYFDEQLTEKFSNSRFVELYEAKAKIDLYANWVDRVTVTKDNFDEFFKVSSRWNGGLNAGGNAAINYSFEPVMAYDPTLSTQSIEISVTPHIGSWSNGSNTILLQSDDDYFYYGQKRIDSSAAGTQFQIGASTLSWTLLTESFELQLLHRDPLTIHLDLDGGVCEKDSLEVEGGRKLLKSDLPTPQKSGYKFMGWYVDPEYDTEYEEKPITRERTFYAKFTKEVTVTFHPNGGTEGDALHLLSGDLIKTYTPQREDYKFMGWYTDSAFANKLETGAKAAEEDVNLYAKWAKIHTVTFETNGGSAIEAMRVVDGEMPQLGSINTIKSGVTFMGWYTEPLCENKYEAGPIEGDITLYALWARELSLYNPSIEDLKQYINFEITEEYTKITENNLSYNVRQFKVTASIKEEYLRLGLHIYNGKIEIKFTTKDNQDGGNGYFEKLTLSTSSGKLEYEGVYSVKQNYVAYEDSTTWKLNPYLTCVVYLPEETTELAQI